MINIIVDLSVKHKSIKKSLKNKQPSQTYFTFVHFILQQRRDKARVFRRRKEHPLFGLFYDGSPAN